MTDKLAPVLPKLAPLLRMLGSDIDGEALNAARALRKALASVDADFHDIVDALEKPATGPTDDELAQLYDAATAEALRKFRRMREETQRKCGYRPDGSWDWEAISLFCQRRGKGKLAPNENQFVNDMAARTAKPEWAPSEKQAQWVLSIFRRFGGIIDND